MKRGNYNEVILSSLTETQKKRVNKMVDNATKSEKIDEHGAWEFGAEFDKKGRGAAINWDLYAIGKDKHTKKDLIVIQIRKWEKQRKNGFANIQKSYFLIGTNEDKTTFAHCVESRVIHNAIKKNIDVIMAVQTWMFGCDYSKVLRQGDIAMIPCKKPNSEVMLNEYILEGSHLICANEIRINGGVYANNPVLTHTPGTHPVVEGKGWFKIVVAKRKDHHDFAAPTID